MLTVAYLANVFPSEAEPYVAEEIAELRRRGVQVITGSVRTPGNNGCPEIVLQRIQPAVLTKALWLLLQKVGCLAPLLLRILFQGEENLSRRLKAFLHIFLGACYAVRLQTRAVRHIHVHHGYFGSFIGMVAARLLGIPFSLTLHGSDLLLHGTYLDLKLKNCDFCFTVSDYNRNYILSRYPEIESGKIIVSRLGVDVPSDLASPPSAHSTIGHPFMILSVGRLHSVKDHAFLLRACGELHAQGTQFHCYIAGNGPERHRLGSLIQECDLAASVTLLGQVRGEKLQSWYERADVVVLTSRSEGIPLVLMEAMAHGKLVLAPAITGIPELVSPGTSGFLYEPGSLPDLVAQLQMIRDLTGHETGSRFSGVASPVVPFRLDGIRHAARAQVQQKFNRDRNLQTFAELFLQRASSQTESACHENFVLQQI